MQGIRGKLLDRLTNTPSAASYSVSVVMLVLVMVLRSVLSEGGSLWLLFWFSGFDWLNWNLRFLLFISWGSGLALTLLLFLGLLFFDLTFDLLALLDSFGISTFLEILSGFLSDWLLDLLAAGTNTLAVKLARLGLWDGTGIASAGVGLSGSCRSRQLLLELFVPPVSLLESSNQILLLWTNWCIVISISAFNSVNISTVDIGAGIIGTSSGWIKVVSISLSLVYSLLDETLWINLLIKVLLTIIEPVLPLLVRPRRVVIHGIVLADGVRIAVIFISLLLGVMMMVVVVLVLEGIDVEEHVCVQACVVFWVVHCFVLEFDGRCAAEKSHYGQRG